MVDTARPSSGPPLALAGRFMSNAGGGRRERPWSHRNTPQAILARQEALRALPGWRPEDARIFPGPASEPERLAATQESFTAQMVLPVSVVGPLHMDLGRYAWDGGGGPREVGRSREEVLLPLAHTEGGLSASLQRGILAVNRDGGVRTYVLADGMTRDALYAFSTAGEALAAGRWVEDHQGEMASWLAQRAAEAQGQGPHGPMVSRHARLVGVRTHVLGEMLHVLYRFHTGEAVGLNMVTRNTYVLSQEYVLPRLREELGLVPQRTLLEANMGGDKKPSLLYQAEGGHGKTVLAEAALSRPTLRHLLHVTPEDLVELATAGLHGSHASGMLSFGFTPATVVAALFAVTGQDLGMVGTSSMAHVTVSRLAPGTRPQDGVERSGRQLRPYQLGGVHVSVRLPTVEVGTVGGGTVLPCAETYLRLLGCTGEGSAYRLAQIVAAAVLALEVSAGAAMASPGSREFFWAHWRRGGIRRPSPPSP
jgi:hydroxymethylglutaryl-CoA reductase (NADPH)